MAGKTTFLSQAEIKCMAEEAVRPLVAEYAAMVDALTATIRELTGMLTDSLVGPLSESKPSLTVVAGRGRGSKRPPAKLASVQTK
jgi:hypothetical protein